MNPRPLLPLAYAALAVIVLVLIYVMVTGYAR
jgi:hypothetical protein